MVEDIAKGAGGQKFNCKVDQIEHSVANDPPPLRRFCVAQALSRGDGRSLALLFGVLSRE